MPGGVPVKEEEKELTLRDKFALGAMTGILADFEITATASVIAKISYEMADAMLEERAK